MRFQHPALTKRPNLKVEQSRRLLEKASEESDVTDFVDRFKQHGEAIFQNAYHHFATCSIITKRDGTLTTTIDEDVVALLTIQRRVLHDYADSQELTQEERHALFRSGLTGMFQALQNAHQSHLIDSLEGTCASANDFFALADRVEELIVEFLESYPFLAATQADGGAEATPPLRELGSEVVTLYSRAAVEAAEYTATYAQGRLDAPLLMADFFSPAWENELTHNEVARGLVKPFRDDMADVEKYLCDYFLYKKAVLAATKCIVCFYIRCLVDKAARERHERRKPSRLLKGNAVEAFGNRERALLRMRGDTLIFREHLLNKLREHSRTWWAIVDQLTVLELSYELIRSQDRDSFKVFATELQNLLCDKNISRQYIEDLYVLSGLKQGYLAEVKTLASLESRSSNSNSEDTEYAEIVHMIRDRRDENRLGRQVRNTYLSWIPKLSQMQENCLSPGGFAHGRNDA